MTKRKNKDQTNVLEKTISSLDNDSKMTTSASSNGLLFGKKNYMFLLAGCGLIALGFALMSGGSMPSSDVWDESLIYSNRRTLLAPFIIIMGLCLQIWTIFAKKD